MDLIIREGEARRSVEFESGETVLSVLQHAGVRVDAPCGGAGVCGKCRMLIHDETGLSYRLACEVSAEEGMEVVVPGKRAMVVAEGGESVAWPVDEGSSGYGVSIDVGTTTVVCRLHDLSQGTAHRSVGVSNPQIAFGADVITRISACAEGRLDKMRSLLEGELVSMIGQLVESAGIEISQIERVVLAGNTVMEHIAAGVDPQPIGVSPYIAPTLFGEEVEMPGLREAGICDGRVLYAPCIAGYVGGDITCGLLAQDMGNAEGLVLMLDLGTNGEMALGCRDFMVACATAAGPVFEGANIKYGMPAYAGAISQVAWDGSELQIKVIGDGEPVGVCGTGLIDAVALMIEHGLIDETGLILDEDEVDVDRSSGMERYLTEDDDVQAFRLADGVFVTQKDVRCLQLAKAAVCAGIRTMLDDRDVTTDQIGSLVIAGGFGEYLNLAHAASIGLFPPELLDRASSVGNTSIEGAGAACVSAAARKELSRIAGACSYIELSTNATFNDFYIDEMEFAEAERC